jgi:hypothetical protein
VASARPERMSAGEEIDRESHDAAVNPYDYWPAGGRRFHYPSSRSRLGVLCMGERPPCRLPYSPLMPGRSNDVRPCRDSVGASGCLNSNSFLPHVQSKTSRVVASRSSICSARFVSRCTCPLPSAGLAGLRAKLRGLAISTDTRISATCRANGVDRRHTSKSKRLGACACSCARYRPMVAVVTLEETRSAIWRVRHFAGFRAVMGSS